MYTIKFLFNLTVLCCLSLLLAGCPVRQTPRQAAIPETTYTVIDDSGYTMRLSQKPTSIASLSYGTDEMLVGLVDLDRIIAFSRWADDPAITFITPEQAARVSQRAVPFAEALIALKPDLIIASSAMRPEAIQTLREIGIPVYVSKSPKNLPEVKKRVMALAKVVGEEARGQAIIDQMDARLQTIAVKLAPVTAEKTKCVMAFDFIGVIGSRNNLLADMFNYAHLRNGALEGSFDPGENRLSKEQIIAINPDLFMLPTWNYDGHSSVEAYRQQFMTDPALQDVAAVRNNQVFLVPDRYRYVGSHHVVDSIEMFAKTAYPELF